MGLFSTATLAEAAAKGRTDLVGRFLKEGQDPNKPDTRGLTPLQRAVIKGHFDVVKILVEKANVDINKRKEEGFDALMYAVFGNHHEIAAYLLNKGAECICSANKYSPIHYVIMNGKKTWAIELLELMLKSGANPNCIDKLNQTPLEHSFHRKSAEIIQLLVAFGADACKLNIHGFAIIHRMVTAKDFSPEDRLATVAAILKTGTDPNTPSRDGVTPLHMAAHLTDKEGLEMVRLLIMNGADPQARDAKGHTPLDMAQEKGNTEILRCLQKCKPD